MVGNDGVHGDEVVKVVAVRHVVAGPRDHIERRVVDLRVEELACKRTRRVGSVKLPELQGTSK